ncbi:MAG: fibronectin type III domain-containing protein, partial [Muribaculaceae bacterium]|nr:fibronectin type III domain-containing protein [Muribaculaceae bacterium]
MKKITALLAIGLGCAANAVGATAGDYAFQGYVNYTNTDDIGWFYVADDGAKTFAWTDALAQSIQSPMVFGWMREGRICGVSSVSVSGSIRSYEYVEIDPATGEYELSKPISLRGENNQANYLNYYRVATYDPTTDRVYGYGHNADGTAFVFKSSAPDFTDTRVIREISDAEYCSSITYNASENRLVGFNRVSFVYIDKQTGMQTQAYNPNLNNFMFTYTGLMYDMNKRAYYWSYFTNDNKSHLALVDLNNKRLSVVCDYADMTQFSFMVPMNDSSDPAAPEKPLFGEVAFPKGVLSGTVTFTLPEKTNGGVTVSGDVDWTLSVDGNDVAKGSGKAGAEVSQSVENLTPGEHLFMVTAKYNGKESMPDSKTCYIGPDVPGIPANVRLDATTVRWDAVTEGIHGGYVDPAAIVYNVTLNGQPLGQTSQTEMAVTYPADVRYTAFTASVSAVNGTEESEGGVSNVFLAGKPLALPLSLSPDKNQAMLFTVEDTDKSGDVWSFNNDVLGQEVFVSDASESAVDEWLFLPPVECQKANGVYKISLNAALSSADAKEAKIEIRAGRKAASEAMKSVVIPLTEVSNTAFKEYSGLFSLSGDLLGAEGVVIGVRAYVPDGGARIKTRRFRVELTNLSDKAPCDPSELTVEAGAAGALNAKVSFVMPSKTLDGVDIPSDTDVTVTILNDSKDVVTGKPGSRQSVTIDAYQGINEVEVTPSLGSVKGQKQVREVYCGVDIPRGVENMQVKVSEDNLSAVVTWSIPAKGINGGYIDPEGLTYWLCVYDKNTDSYRQYAELGNTPEYVMQLPEGSKLQTYDVIIQAVSATGASPEYASERVQLGTPYT